MIIEKLTKFEDELKREMKDKEYAVAHKAASRRWDLALEIIKIRERAKMTQENLAFELKY